MSRCGYRFVHEFIKLNYQGEDEDAPDLRKFFRFSVPYAYRFNVIDMQPAQKEDHSMVSFTRCTIVVIKFNSLRGVHSKEVPRTM